MQSNFDFFLTPGLPLGLPLASSLHFPHKHTHSLSSLTASQTLTWSISSSWALAPGHSIATLTMSDGGGIFINGPAFLQCRKQRGIPGYTYTYTPSSAACGERVRQKGKVTEHNNNLIFYLFGYAQFKEEKCSVLYVIHM